MKQIKAFLLTLLLTQQAVWCGNCTSQPVTTTHQISHILNAAIETGILDLSYPVLNFLDSSTMATLLMHIKNDLRIHTIDLSGNKLPLMPSKQLTLLCALLSELPYIQTLCLSSCNLASMKPENLEQVATLVVTMPDLQNVDLSDNRLGNRVQLFVNYLAIIRHSMNIDLRGNLLGHLYIQDFERLFLTMNQLSHIEFDLRNNLLFSEEDQTVIQLLSRLNLHPHLQLE